MSVRLGLQSRPPSTVERAHDVAVVWYAPGLASAETFRSGTKKKLLDIFGPWTSLHTLTLAEGRARNLPAPVVNLADILECNFALSSDGTLPYDVFDALRRQHGIDVTGLSMSSTHRGNLYRSYALLGGCEAMAACEAQCAQEMFGATPVLAAMRLHLLRALLKNSRAPDLCRCLRACGIPATKTRKHAIVQDMFCIMRRTRTCTQ